MGTSIQMVMVKSSTQMMSHLQELATYNSFKAWCLAVEDWLFSNTHTTPDNLGPATVCTIAHLTRSLDVYSWLETCGMLEMT